jgi:hypothetical protein
VKTLVGCPCCTSDQHGAYLAARPVRSLTPSDLARFGWKAMTTWGTVDDFKHFLPRVFELAIADDPSWELEVVFGKLAYGHWRDWPAGEQRAVEAFLWCLWEDTLAKVPYVVEADACLCAIAQAVEDLRPHLRVWERDDRRSAALHFAEFVHFNVGAPSKGQKPVALANAFWTSRPAQASQVLSWLVAPERAEYLERAFFRATDATDQEALSMAQQEHSWIRHYYATNGAQGESR